MQDSEEPTVVGPLEAIAERISEAWGRDDLAAYRECRGELERLGRDPSVKPNGVEALVRLLAAAERELDLGDEPTGLQAESMYQQLIEEVGRVREGLERCGISRAVTLTYRMEATYRGHLMQSVAQRDPAGATQQLARLMELGKQIEGAEPEEAEAAGRLQRLLRGLGRFITGMLAGMEGDPAACEVALQDALSDLRFSAGPEADTDMPGFVTLAEALIAVAWGTSRRRAGRFDEAIEKFKDAARVLHQAATAPGPLSELAKGLACLVQGSCATAEAERSLSVGQLGDAARHYGRAAVAFRDAQRALPSAFDSEGASRKRVLASAEDALTRSRTLFMAQAALWPRWSVFLHGVLFVVLWLGSTVGLLCASHAVELGVPWWGAAIVSLVASGVALRFVPVREAVLLLRGGGRDRDASPTTELEASAPAGRGLDRTS